MLPTFSPAGWVTNPLEKLDFLLSYFFTTQPSQTHFHKNQISSYQTLISDAADEGELETTLRVYLQGYLETQFENVELDVNVSPFDDKDNNNKLEIEIGCSFDANGVRYSMGHAIELLGTQVKRISRLNETGEI